MAVWLNIKYLNAKYHSYFKQQTAVSGFFIIITAGWRKKFWSPCRKIQKYLKQDYTKISEKEMSNPAQENYEICK